MLLASSRVTSCHDSFLMQVPHRAKPLWYNSSLPGKIASTENENKEIAIMCIKQMRHVLAVTAVGVMMMSENRVVAAEYQNDFSARTSKVHGMDGWLSMPYANGAVAYNFDETKYWPALPYDDASKVQDGWVKARLNAGGTAADVEVVGTDNKYLRFTATNNVAGTAVMHTFGNEFSNGVLRIQCDFRAIGSWSGGNGGEVRMMPLCKAFVNPNAWTGSVTVPANWGFVEEGWYTYNFLLGGDQWNNAIANYIPSSKSKCTAGHWYRYVTDLDFDNGQISCTVYDQGDGLQPFDGENGALVGQVGPTKIYRQLSAETGPVVGIVIRTTKYSGSNPVVDASLPAIDNLSASWKAPGSASFARCYENDFSERRSRTLVQETPRHDYVHDTPVDSLTFTGYNVASSKTAAGTPILQNSLGSAHRNETAPDGTDGWRRLNVDGNGDLHVVKGDSADAGGTMLRASKGYNFVIGANSFGQKVTSGKVRFSGDIRAPNKWIWINKAGFLVGGDSFYAAATDNVWTSPACVAGLGGSSNTDLKPHYKDANGDDVFPAGACTWTTWYRVIVTADMEAKTFDYALYKYETNSPSPDWVPTQSDLVCEVKGCAFRSTFADDGLSSFAVYSYGHNTINISDSNVYFDNIRVWKNVGTANEKEIYRNLFSERTVWPETSSTRGVVLSDTFNADNGQDHWIRRNNASGDGECYITSAGNPCVAASAYNGTVRAVQSLGYHYRQNTVYAQVDIRPPAKWVWTAGRQANIEFGDDEYRQGNYYSGNPYTGSIAFAAGFTAATGASDATGAYTNVCLFAGKGDGAGGLVHQTIAATIDTSHWYRFKFKTGIAEGKWALNIYDQGATHPAANSADGTLVASLANLAFVKAPDGGLSAVGLYSTGNRNGAREPEDAGLALFDNIKVWQDPMGMKILIR